MCLVDRTQPAITIMKWQLYSLKGKNISEYTSDLIDQMRKSFFGVIDYVLIEQQVSRNTQMKVLSHVLQAYFMTAHSVPPEKVIFLSAKRRFKTKSPHYNIIVNSARCELGLGETDKLGRKDIKKLAVKIVTDKEITLDPVWRDFFAKNSKKDDLADSFLQAYTWCVDGSSWSDLMQID